MPSDGQRCQRMIIPVVVLVRDIMSRDVLKISESATVEQLTSILTRHRLTGLPGLDNRGKITGIASEFDVIDRKGRTAADIMSRGPITSPSDAAVAECARLVV